MSLFFSSLNSGSNGNCYYIGNDTEAVLIDAGISCRETEKRLKRSGLSIEKIKAIFISHEHSDHISGLTVLSKKYDLPVYITNSTLQYSGLSIRPELVTSFQANSPVSIGSLTITPFSKFHDAADPHSFVVSQNNLNIGVFTDIGVPCKNIIKYFKQCHAVMLEANYCADMLASGSYPYMLKKRITGGKGHLSNTAALDLFVNHKSEYLSHLILSHLSKNNNCPDLVYNLFSSCAGNTRVIVASRYEETEVFQLESVSGVSHRKTSVKNGKDLQLNLF